MTSSLKPVDKSDHTEKTVEIPIGSSIGTISTVLEEEGIVRNARVFKYYVKFRNESGFQAGKYTLSPSMTIEKDCGYDKNREDDEGTCIKNDDS